MKKLFEFNDLERIEKFIEVINAQYYDIIIDKENSLLLIDEETNNYNQTIMGLMEIIRRNESIQNCFDSWFDGLDRIHKMPLFINDKQCLPGWSLDGISIENAIIIDYTIQEIKINQDSFKRNPNNLGIEEVNAAYIETNELQEPKYEYKKITKFLYKYKEHYAKCTSMNPEDIKIEFINYGKTELVYVLTDKLKNRYTLLVKQPKVNFGDVKKEADYLTELNALHENIIAPIEYFSLYDQELFVTPYIYQARCIASDSKWGMYIPEPFYRFENFNEEQESIVNQCMIAKLVSFYDFEKQEGISACKLGGGDFMLSKGWESECLTIENTLNNLYFIAARQKIRCSFEEYTEILLEEYSRITIDEDEDKVIINKRGRVAMNIIDIQNGIELGKKIIKERKGFGLKKN